MGLGNLPGDTHPAIASDVSADGKVVVGLVETPACGATFGSEAWRWTAAGGMTPLGSPSGSCSQAHGVSADGAIVVGDGRLDSGREATRWTVEDGMVGLGGGSRSQANSVSADGSVIVGVRNVGSDSEAFRWTAGEGLIGLGDLGGDDDSVAHDVSADGHVIVGESLNASFLVEAFRWSSDQGMVGLGFLPEAVDSAAYGANSDGSIIVGSSADFSSTEAFRWTSDDGMVGLGNLPGSEYSRASSVNSDGTVVVGESRIRDDFGVQHPEAFLWTTEDGMRFLEDVLTTDYGLDLAGWELYEAKSVSADGKVIVGRGRGPTGLGSWIASLRSGGDIEVPKPQPTLPSIPPSAPTAGVPDLTPGSSDTVVVIVHGFQHAGDTPDWIYKMRDEIVEQYPGTQVVTWLWHDAFGSLADFDVAYAQTAQQGVELAAYLQSISAEKVHLIGHSLGTRVNAYAALELEERGISVEHVTVLDRPFGVVPIQDAKERAILTYTLKDVDFVDNYYGGDHNPLGGFPAVGGPLAGVVNVELLDRDHSGVHQFYNGTIGSSTSPGFIWSTVASGPPGQSELNFDLTPSNVYDINFDNSQWKTANSTVNAILNEAVLVEGSPAYLWIDLGIPEDVLFLAFEFRWGAPGDGDYLTVHFDDILLFAFLWTEAVGMDYIWSGFLDIGEYAGTTGQLLFSLNSVGNSNSQIHVRDVSLFTLRAASVDEPQTGPILLAGLSLLILVRLARSSKQVYRAPNKQRPC